MCFSWQTSDFLRRIWTCYDIFLWSDDSACFWPVIIWLLLGKLWTDCLRNFGNEGDFVQKTCWQIFGSGIWISQETTMTTFNVGWRLKPTSAMFTVFNYSSDSRFRLYASWRRKHADQRRWLDVLTGCIQSDSRRDSCKLAATAQKDRICSSQIQCIYYHSLDSTTTDSDILHSSLRQSCSVSYTSVTVALEVSSNDMPICAI